METQNKRLAIYCRCSSEESAQNGITIAAQEAVCRETALRDGFTVSEVIKDEGRSGGDMNRPGIRRLRQLAEDHAIDAVLMIHSDRLARNTGGHIEIMDLFGRQNIEVRYVYQQTLDRTTASGYMMDTVLAAVAEHYRRVISEKTLSALKEKAKEGWYPGMIPIGYTSAENPLFRKGEMSKHIIVPDPESASFITEMFHLYATGNYNGTDLNELMHKKGLRTKRGARVSFSVTYQILGNPFYIGEMHWRDIHLKEAKHEPLIDRSTFERVQAILSAHIHYANRRRKYWFLLRGLVKCDEHRKNRYTAEWHTKKSGLRFAYYHCSNQVGCDGGAVEMETLESEVGALFQNLRFSSSFIENIVSRAKTSFEIKSKQHDSRVKILTSQKNRLMGRRKIAEEKLFKGVLGDEDFTRIRREIVQEMGDIDSEIKQLEKQRETNTDIAQEVLRLARDVYDSYKKAPPVLKQKYHTIFFKEIFAYKKQLTQVVYSELFEEMLELRVLTRVKTTQNMDRVILRHQLGA